tara:strand:+ start:188 stop:523 length:336 start_codon:yes stop_codon:yes gene_type:complete
VAPEPSRVLAIKISFEPKSRTAWHTNPLGQPLFVLSEFVLVGLGNKALKIINVGNSVLIAPNVENWHGAIKEYLMENMAIHEKINWEVANWQEQVLDYTFIKIFKFLKIIL